MCGMVNVRWLERNTTATTPVLPFHCLLTVMNFSRYTLFLSSTYVFISPSGKLLIPMWCPPVFVSFFFLISSSRNSAQDMTMEIEVSAAMPTSYTP